MQMISAQSLKNGTENSVKVLLKGILFSSKCSGSSLTKKSTILHDGTLNNLISNISTKCIQYKEMFVMYIIRLTDNCVI